MNIRGRKPDLEMEEDLFDSRLNLHEIFRFSNRRLARYYQFLLIKLSEPPDDNSKYSIYKNLRFKEHFEAISNFFDRNNPEEAPIQMKTFEDESEKIANRILNPLEGNGPAQNRTIDIKTFLSLIITASRCMKCGSERITRKAIAPRASFICPLIVIYKNPFGSECPYEKYGHYKRKKRIIHSWAVIPKEKLILAIKNRL